MKEEQISGGYIVLVQWLIFLFGMPFIAFICYLLVDSRIEKDGKYFLCAIILVVFLMLKYILIYGDIYLSGENVIIKKNIGVKTKHISQIKSLDEALVPFTYYIEFKDNKKVYFRLKPKDILKRITSADSDILENLRSKFNLNNNNH
jgi:hypothetical protein